MRSAPGCCRAWLTGLTLLGVPLAHVDTGSYDSGPLAIAGVIGLVFFLAWSLVIGTTLLARPPHPAPAARSGDGCNPQAGSRTRLRE